MPPRTAPTRKAGGVAQPRLLSQRPARRSAPVIYRPFNPPIVEDFTGTNGAFLDAKWMREWPGYDRGGIFGNQYAPSNQFGGAAVGADTYIAGGPREIYDFAVTVAVLATTGQFVIESVCQTGVGPSGVAPWQGFAAIFRANDAVSGFIDIYEFANDAANYITTAVDNAGATRVAPYVAGSQIGMRVRHDGWEVYSRDSAVDTWRLNYAKYTPTSAGLLNVGLSYPNIRFDFGVNSTARMDDFRYQDPLVQLDRVLDVGGSSALFVPGGVDLAPTFNLDVGGVSSAVTPGGVDVSNVASGAQNVDVGGCLSVFSVGGVDKTLGAVNVDVGGAASTITPGGVNPTPGNVNVPVGGVSMIASPGGVDKTVGPVSMSVGGAVSTVFAGGVDMNSPLAPKPFVPSEEERHMSPILNKVNSGQVALTGSAQQLTAEAGASGGVKIKALTTNANPLYIGEDNNVSATTGYPLGPGQEVTINILSLNKIWVIGTAAERLAYICVG